MIAALYVDEGGCYYGMPHVDPWPESRDARKYAGPHPVVAHPPCERWGLMWTRCRPVGHPHRGVLGDDGGCFASALAAVRQFGGVLEHPASSRAWDHFGLSAPPSGGGWVVADFVGGWTCHIDQVRYGHQARKATWLYAHGVELPSLRWWGKERPTHVVTRTTRPGTRADQLPGMRKQDRRVTPIAFRDLLISIAETANGKRSASANNG